MPEMQFKREIVINRRYGGFGLSDAAVREVARRCKIELVEESGMMFVAGGDYKTIESVVARDNEHLIAVVREMGEAANGGSAKLAIVEVTCTIEVTSDDGLETVVVYGAAA